MSIFIFLSIFLCFSAITNEAKVSQISNIDTYIVHVSLPLDKEPKDLENWYQSFVEEMKADANEPSRIVHSYKHVVTGFAARLSNEEVKVLEKKEGFLYARAKKKLSLHTTHSPSFLGLEQNFGFWLGSNYGKNVIIGVIDGGISPDHPSFDDQGMPSPPAKWKGRCDLKGALCNNKLIGARNFVNGSYDQQPIDTQGHGTHTASTAAGNYVKNANVYGNANGTAVGMAPLAHLAIYKVCTLDDCSDSDILAAMDAAVEDGVDVISISLGGDVGTVIPFWNDTIAIGAFGAIKNGVFVSCSAGNSGPLNSTLVNDAPWILTVGASTMDRSIRATAVLENNAEFDGESAFQPQLSSNELLPLVYFGSSGDINATFCAPGSLNLNTDVQGKIVLCEREGNVTRINKGQAVKDGGGLGMILMGEEADANSVITDVHVLPATEVSYAAGEEIKAYINSTFAPKAKILFKGTILGVENSPSVASFSSRGPSLASPGILKPDILGPGVSILAAWPISVDNSHNTKSTFNLATGTSMSCPHLSGIAALLKNAHPNWSPAAIKSAIMTTADVLNNNHRMILDERLLQADIFATGAGHVNPSKANDPGLVYDVHHDDYIPYLCGLGYNDKKIEVIVARKIACNEITSIEEAELNYPSFAIKLGSTEKSYKRTVTNVGEGLSSYYADVQLIPGVDVFVQPSILNFTEVNQKISYQISFKKSGILTNESYVQGSISWVSDHHVVSSPISIKLSD